MIAALGLFIAEDKAQDAASSSDLQALQGPWKLVSAMRNGKPLTKETVKKTKIIFKKDTFRFPKSAEYATSREGTIKIDATKTPKQMDATSPKNEVMHGIYELNGDNYKVCFAPVGKPRPTEFGSSAENGQILQVWKRKKGR